MIFLIISIFASSAIGIVMRLSLGRIKYKMSMLAANYITCAVCALCYLGGSSVFPKASGLNIAVTLGAVNGMIYLTTLILQEYSIKKNGVVLPSVFSRTGSLIVPLFISIVFFAERPGTLQIVGAVLAAAAIIAMNGGGRQKGSVYMLPLLALFFSDGMGSSMAKVFEQTGNSELGSHFLLYTFSSALIFCTVLVIAKKEKPGIKEALFGVMIGVPNYFASRFLLLALGSIPAVIAYPIRSVGSILVLALAGIFMFREKLTKRQWYAIAVILAAVVLLSIK